MLVYRPMARLRYSYRLYPTPEQRTALAQTFGCVRVAWNDALARAKAPGAKYAGYCVASKLLTESKKTEERSWLAEVSCVPLQQSLRNMDCAFQAFFRGVAGNGPRRGFPTWKNKYDRQSAEFTSRAFSVKDGKLYLAKVGLVHVRWSRKLPSIPKTATVTLDAAGRYHVSFTVEKHDAQLTGGAAVGVDLGIKTFAVLSTGEEVHGPDYSRLERQIGKAQRRLARCVKGSNRRQAARLRVAKTHAKVADKRRDFVAKLSTRLVREHSSIVLEDLNVSGMVKNHSLARAISRQGWRAFRTLVEEKCSRYGREFVVISRWEPTSQICNKCGHRWGRLNLSVRTVTCEACGAVHDRDVNAARNIVAAGLADTENGRGGHVSHGDLSGSACRLVEASTAGVRPGILAL